MDDAATTTVTAAHGLTITWGTFEMTTVPAWWGDWWEGRQIPAADEPTVVTNPNPEGT